MVLESRGSMKGPNGRKSAFQEVFSIELFCYHFAFLFLPSFGPDAAASAALNINNILYLSNQPISSF
jgi:hypothetical protein